MDYTDKINDLTMLIIGSPNDVGLLMERGRLHHKMGSLDKALNDFISVLHIDSENIEAQEQIDFINDIFRFRYNDLYNP